MRPRCRVGAAGWHYAHWRGSFYPASVPPDQWLSYYARYFDTVEINRSFYRLPSPETWREWYDGVPADFCFAVKASRYLTHWKKLKSPQLATADFMRSTDALGEKRGPLLFQLPPRWRCNTQRLAQFLAVLPSDGAHVFEFRDPSWHCDDVYALLARHNAAFCIYDLGGFQSPRPVTADFAYLRLHGPDAPYCGSYAEEALRRWAEEIGSWRRLRQVYVYFDNDQAGYAVDNALRLKTLLGEARLAPD